ncbi:hypothetical protein [Pararobbsia alpina]|uniref:Uncharacterized protein n=1 Tax=Pararobbsia alpina TaxID=621374 RepID=A0A6S7BTE7_9BURK|nr:hypothetical protein [Pararobbsia alpina]CAB3794357.1 hypothetical protein LMG28138_03677 [Pararobbsia alpina]
MGMFIYGQQPGAGMENRLSSHPLLPLEDDDVLEQSLANEIAQLRLEIKRRDNLLQERDRLLREWMLSQEAFKSLFRKYGRLPDGRMIVDLPSDEKSKLIEDEEAAILRIRPDLAR